MSYRDLNRDLKLLFWAIFLWSFGQGLYNFLWPNYVLELGASPVTLGSLFSFAFFIATLSSLPGGYLADHFDRRGVMIAGWLVALPAPVLYGLARDWRWLVPGILLFFLSFFCNSATQAYVAGAAQRERLTGVYNLVFSSFPLGMVLSPALGGYLAETWGMRLVFFLATGFMIASTVLLFLLTPQRSFSTGPEAADEEGFRKTKRKPGAKNAQIDQDAAETRAFRIGGRWLKGTLLGGWELLIGGHEVRKPGSEQVRIWPKTPGADRLGRSFMRRWIVLFVGDPGLWHRLLPAMSFFGLLVGILTLVSSFSSPFLQEVAGLDKVWIGLLGSVNALGSGLISPPFGHLADRIGKRRAMPLGMLAYGVTLLAFVFWPGSLFLLFLNFFLRGSGDALRGIMNSTVGETAPPEQAGRAFALFNLTTGVGAMVFPYLGGVLYSRAPAYPFQLMAVLLLIGAGFLWYQSKLTWFRGRAPSRGRREGDKGKPEGSG
ncbi:MAG: MFS transporter [Firmicutes bacterium]|nr:MFS transporter [Bacillota bacterium]MCL5040445.1 MFS transporter [Bacillota bacterium]